ncbi:hypothetical protein QLZ27_20960 [Cronobacter malonaticus]|uniref:hypothetical protein n=1 Tax=Cronobacter malonaticus TaxID=413503 RepID=UPI0024AF6F0D|nr:hypothetical protein [Cronobacter malonaticus]MDI7691708.1 hypothetical protein [Cronobacter malonaticus]
MEAGCVRRDDLCVGRQPSAERITQRGNRIDCAAPGETNLRGTSTGNRADVAFDSTFGGVNGQASLEVEGDRMTWRLIKVPVKGSYYAPQTFTLTRNRDGMQSR